MLDILRRTIQEVNNAPDLQRALQIIVERVKQAIVVDVCSVYLVDQENQQHVLMATDGYNPKAVGQVRLDFKTSLVSVVARREEPLNMDDASTHPDYVFTRELDEQPYHGFLGVPIIQHRKVVGVLVVRQRDKRRFAETEEAFLVTLAAQLAGAITHAEATGEITHLLQDSGERRFALKGKTGISGAAIGFAHVVYPRADLDAIPDRRVDDMESEIAAFRAAIAHAERDMRTMSARMVDAIPAEDIALFDALILMLRSENLVDGTIERIRAGNWAPGALRDTIHEHVKVFEAMDDAYLRERASDVRDIGRRVLEHLQNISPAKLDYYPRTVLIGEEISASQLAEVPANKLAAVVSAKGSSASHVAILARALGIPAVMGIGDLPAGRLDGQELIVDGYECRVFVKPSHTLREEFQRLEREESELSEGLRDLTDQPAETPDGHKVPLYANTGLLTDITPSLRSGADGVGLYRTEIPFLVRDRFPGEEEQKQIYRQVLEAFVPAPVTVRTLDIGGDKMLSYFPVREENPFLGWRGIRILLDHPEIFLTQLRAILRANEGLNNLQLLLPMITDIGEIDSAIGLIRRAVDELVEEGKQIDFPPLGVMIEVPSVIYQIDAIAKRVDFFSVGSNDLTQYLLAVDRNNSQVAGLYDSLHPAVLRAINQAISSAHAAGKPISVCGEMAGDPMAALLLLAMGVDSLSMSAASLLRVKWVIRTVEHTTARKILNEVLALEDVHAVRALMHKYFEEAGLGGLVRAGR